jgi:hypothetical protein
LIIELNDLRAARAQAGAAAPPSGAALAAAAAPASINVVWVGLVHGVLGPLGSTLTEAPIASIQQAFAQAPYLHH